MRWSNMRWDPLVEPPSWVTADPGVAVFSVDAAGVNLVHWNRRFLSLPVAVGLLNEFGRRIS